MCNPTRFIKTTNSTPSMRTLFTALLCTVLYALDVSAYPSEHSERAQRPLAVSEFGPSPVVQTEPYIVQAWRFNTTSASETKEILMHAKVRASCFDCVPAIWCSDMMGLTNSLECRNSMRTFGPSRQTISTCVSPPHSSLRSYLALADRP